jgi:hypothetical protein
MGILFIIYYLHYMLYMFTATHYAFSQPLYHVCGRSLAFLTPTTQFSGFIYLNLPLDANEVLLHIILISVGAGLDGIG